MYTAGRQSSSWQGGGSRRRGRDGPPRVGQYDHKVDSADVRGFGMYKYDDESKSTKLIRHHVSSDEDVGRSEERVGTILLPVGPAEPSQKRQEGVIAKLGGSQWVL